MKKTFVILLIVGIIIISFGALYINSDQGREHPDIQDLFSRWDRGEVEGPEKTRIMNALADHLRNNPQFSLEEIEAISNNITIIDADALRVIQYIEHPEFYGASGRESYQLVIHGDQVYMIDSKQSIRIEDIERRNEHLYYVYATDYKVSNMTGIQIFEMEIKDGAVHQRSLINNKRLAEHFRYDAQEVLYYEDGHIAFKEILDHGEEVLISAGDSDFLLQLGAEALYYVSSK